MTAPVPNLVRIAVVGAGTIGRGWASLAASHGWHAALYDPDASAIDGAIDGEPDSVDVHRVDVHRAHHSLQQG